MFWFFQQHNINLKTECFSEDLDSFWSILHLFSVLNVWLMHCFPSATHEQGLGHATWPLCDNRQHILAPICGDAPSLRHRSETPGEQLQDPLGNILRPLRCTFWHHNWTSTSFVLLLGSVCDISWMWYPVYMFYQNKGEQLVSRRMLKF